MLDGSDAIADWPLLNALTATSSGATWVSFAPTAAASASAARSRRPGQPCRRHPLAAEARPGLTSHDPGMGVIRHVDAGYDRAEEVAAERRCVPMREG